MTLSNPLSSRKPLSQGAGARYRRRVAREAVRVPREAAESSAPAATAARPLDKEGQNCGTATTTGTTVTPTNPTNLRSEDRRFRYWMLRHLRFFTSRKGTAKCSTFAPAGDATIYEGDGGRCGWRGVNHCDSIWCCPVCAPRRGQAYRNKLLATIARTQDTEDAVCVFVTATVPHHAGDRLNRTADAIRDAWRHVFAESGRVRSSWRDDWGLLHTVRALDVTVGDNGWHPHIHAVLWIDAAMFEEEELELDDFWPESPTDARPDQKPTYLESLTDHFFARWDLGARRALGVQGPQMCVSPKAIKVETLRSPEAVGDYVTKIAESCAWEMTARHTKQARSAGGRSPWELLADICYQREEFAAAEDVENYPLEELEHDLALWDEYERAMHGRHLFRATRGLWAWAGVAELDDRQCADLVACYLGEDRQAKPRPLLDVPGWLYSALVRDGVEWWPLELAERQSERWAKFVAAVTWLRNGRYATGPPHLAPFGSHPYEHAKATLRRLQMHVGI